MPMVLKYVMPKITDHIMKVFKLDKVLSYVEQPNELDMQVKSLQKSVNRNGKSIEELEKNIAILKNIVSQNDSIKDKFKKVRF